MLQQHRRFTICAQHISLWNMEHGLCTRLGDTTYAWTYFMCHATNAKCKMQKNDTVSTAQESQRGKH